MCRAKRHASIYFVLSFAYVWFKQMWLSIVEWFSRCLYARHIFKFRNCNVWPQNTQILWVRSNWNIAHWSLVKGGHWNKSTLGRVTPFRRPRSVNNIAVERSFLGILRLNGQMALKVKANDSHIFNNSHANLKMHIWCKFGDSSSNPLHVIARTSQIS